MCLFIDTKLLQSAYLQILFFQIIVLAGTLFYQSCRVGTQRILVLGSNKVENYISISLGLIFLIFSNNLKFTFQKLVCFDMIAYVSTLSVPENLQVVSFH